MIESAENEIGTFKMITPLCACCKNAVDGLESLNGDCKVFGESPLDIKIGKIYKCDKFKLVKNIHYDDIKNKIKL